MIRTLYMKELIFMILTLPFTSVFALDLEQAKEILKPFKLELMRTLKEDMKKNGAVSALKTCNLKAIPITNKHALKVVGLGRTSHKLRNPKNAPLNWVSPYLEKYQSGELKKPMVIQLKNGNHGYLEPINIQGTCLQCHGIKRAPGVDEALKKLYPQDKAVGFKMGDFRGLFWLETKS